jgi:F-type H+-transporting ATPase subunit b
MGEIFNTFGVTWGKFLAQVIIFVAVYMILKKYAFGPITAVLDERKRRIAEGEENLKKISADLAAAEEQKQALLDAANASANRMVSEAKESAEAVGEAKKQAAVNEASQIIAKSREASQLEREQLLAELKRDFGRLVIDTTSKVTGKVLTSDDQERINKETAAQVAL